jgi:hypothetical protein
MRSHAGPRALLAVCAALAAGCGSSGSTPLGEVGSYDAEGGVFEGTDAATPAALDARIEEDGVRVTIVTVACAGDCATVEAVGTGGRPPYSFGWEDGSTVAQRRVCPSEGATYRVTVTDTGTSGEFARPPQKAEASVTGEVLACPDAGSGPCVTNPSFEGTPQGPGFWSFMDPGWLSCPPATGTPEVLDPSVTGVTASGMAPPVASDGRTYVGLLDNKGVASTYVAQDLCGVLPAHHPQSFRVDAARLPALPASFFSSSATDGFLQVWGGTSGCAAGDRTAGGELLWTSPDLGTSWGTYCVTVTPSADVTSLAFRALADYSVDTATEVLVDHIVPVASCP